jgi:hypothetical protein
MRRYSFPAAPLRRLSTLAFATLVAACAADPSTPEASDTAPLTPATPPPAPPAGPVTPGAQGVLPTLQLSADTICLTTRVGAAPRPDDVRITTSDGTVVPGLVASVTYEATAPAGWLTTRFDRDTTPTRLWLGADVGSLPIGRYVAQVSVSSSAVGAAPRVITVVLTVNASALKALVLRDRSTYIGDLAPGHGVVMGPGIDCRLGTGDCIEYVPAGTTVTLTATPDPNSALFRWTDACEGTPKTSPCTVTVDDSTVVGSWFSLRGMQLHLIVQGTGASGAVVTGGPPGMFFDCWLIDGAERGCSGGPIDGTRGVWLNAEPYFGSVFAGWSGDCTGTAIQCVLPANPGGTYDVTATFARDPAVGNVLRVTLRPSASGTGRGRVTGSGIDCVLDGSVVTGTCEAAQPVGGAAVLTVTADAGWAYSIGPVFPIFPFGIPCTDPAEPGVCRVTMDGPREVVVGFFP